jgi:anti-anti-sigma regulatory factor
MKMKLEYEVARRTPTLAQVVLNGRIDEHATAALVKLQREIADAKDVELDLRGVTAVNSIGVREWVGFVSGCCAAADGVELHQCSVAFVSQLNVVAGFAGTALVKSIMLPYLCEQCGTYLEVAGAVVVGAPPALGTPACERCHAPMVFDDLKESYFAFLQT